MPGQQSASSETPKFPLGGGKMGALMRSYDWAASPLGEPRAWPQSLKSYVGLMLTATQPMFMAWGRERPWRYNDAFTPILGLKHPDAFGRPSNEVWAEAWTDLEPLFDKVFGGDPVHMEGFPSGLNRRGRIEEAVFDFSYTPVRGDQETISPTLNSRHRWPRFWRNGLFINRHSRARVRFGLLTADSSAL
jgi:hypothetical protein